MRNRKGQFKNESSRKSSTLIQCSVHNRQDPPSTSLSPISVPPTHLCMVSKKTLNFGLFARRREPHMRTKLSKSDCKKINIAYIGRVATHGGKGRLKNNRMSHAPSTCSKKFAFTVKTLKCCDRKLNINSNFHTHQDHPLPSHTHTRNHTPSPSHDHQTGKMPTGIYF